MPRKERQRRRNKIVPALGDKHNSVDIGSSMGRHHLRIHDKCPHCAHGRVFGSRLVRSSRLSGSAFGGLSDTKASASTSENKKGEVNSASKKNQNS